MVQFYLVTLRAKTMNNTHVNYRIINEEFVGLVIYMCKDKPYAEVANWLNENGYVNAWGNPYTVNNISYLYNKWKHLHIPTESIWGIAV